MFLNTQVIQVKNIWLHKCFMRARKSLQASRSVHLQWHEESAARGYTTGVSLHSHTLHSREGLDFIPRVFRRVAVAREILEWAEARHQRETGRPIPFERAFWRPPLHPRAAHDLE